ncbi:MAG: hypothetical protein RL205_1269 [Actinomycetota bacterium]|jgi:hypothetical protein
MGNNQNVQRPFGVTIIMLLIILQGIFGLVIGIFGLFNWKDETPIVVSLITIIFALIYLAVAGALGRGNRGARMLISIITVLVLINGVFWLFSNLWTGVVQIAISVIILLVLFSRKASAFFG